MRASWPIASASCGDVGAGHLGDLGHRVDEADLRGEEGVRRDLHELGGRVVGDEPRGAVGDRRGVHLVEHASAASRSSGDPVDEPVGLEGVLHGVALAQELGVPRERRALRASTTGGEPARRADRHGALADDEVALAQVRQQRRRPRHPRIEVGGVRRRADCGVPTATKCTVAPAASAMSVAESQSTGRDGRGEDLGQARLEERRTPGRQLGDLARVDIDADHLVAELGHRRRVDGAEVAASDDRDSHIAPRRVFGGVRRCRAVSGRASISSG